MRKALVDGPGGNGTLRQARGTRTGRAGTAVGVGVALAGVVLGASGLALAEVALYAERSDPGRADAAIVLGAAILGDRPSPVFEARIRHAVDLYRAGRVDRLVMTGGRGPGARISEAEVARDWAHARGVPPGAIAVETTSRTTRENLVNARTLTAGREARLLVVSDPLHMRRAIALAQTLGLDAHPSPTPTTRYTGWWVWAGFLASEAYLLARCRLSGACAWGLPA